VAKKTSRSKDAREDDGSGSFETYLEYNRVLRTWFVAFGVGGPALFLVNDSIVQRLATAGQLRLVILLFLIGAGAQVLGALLNKIANWYVYSSFLDDEESDLWVHKAAEWVVGQFWIDALLDVLTIGVFGYAAWVLLTVFANG
jgi:hypothetical protein